MKPLLTKSKYVSGVDCQAYLWLLVNDPGKIPEPNSEAKHRMEQGTIVGELARELYPEGINIPAENFKGNLKKTQEMLKERKPLFEPGFIHNMDEGNILARVDILIPVGKNEWDIIEVKSSTKVKILNIHDIAFQKYVCEKNGLKIRKCFLCHINNQYVKEGEINVRELFEIEDVCEDVDEEYANVEDKIKELFGVIKLKKCPKVTPEEIVSAEYADVATDEFYDSLPEENVFELYNMRKKKAMELYQRGVIKIKDLPKSFKLTDKQKIQKSQSGKKTHYVNKKMISTFLESLEYPLYYLDFETFSTAIPLFDKTKPYQQIPFQFSLHVVKKQGAKPRHISFLADGTKDPRLKFLKALKDNLGDKGSIVVYYESFEKGRIKESIEAIPEFEEWGNGILERVVDLLHPFKNFHYYHPNQKGSASIKKVLPIFSKDVKYDDLIISSGADASIFYFKSHFENVPKKEKLKVREHLEKYCELDTLAEVILVNGLREVVDN
jgi:hypothetical protein